jgi:primosomal protein N' (replication factor Y)
MAAIDMRLEDLPAQSWLSPTLTSEVAARVQAGEQALLFLNRRGYAPVTLCRACGAQVGCDHCDARMVEHRFLKRLVCHQCGETKPLPETCPVCGVEGKMAAVGPGVERVAEEAVAAFPDAKIAVLSSDLFGSARALKAQIEEIAEGDTDIIIGTQLVAKGHNFPRLTLVGVVDADLGLQGGDLRAAERTFQLMRQVSGRAGRADKPGVALMQTFQPEHPVIRAILGGDEEAFWRAEAAEREAAGMPPYGRLAGIIISAGDAASAFDLGQHLARNDDAIRRRAAWSMVPRLRPSRGSGVGTASAAGQGAQGRAAPGAISRWMSGIKLPSQVRLAVDIDPQSFY